CVLAVVLALGARRSTAAPLATGRIEGRVVITVPVSSAPPSAAYGARRVEKPAPRTPLSELSNVIVFIEDAPKATALPPMRARIMVFDHTFFTIPKPDGSFTIDDIPAGAYQVSAWHERIGENSQPVKIEAGKASEIRFGLPIVIK